MWLFFNDYMGSLVSIYMRELFKLRTFIYNQPFLHHYFLNRLYNNTHIFFYITYQFSQWTTMECIFII